MDLREGVARALESEAVRAELAGEGGEPEVWLWAADAALAAIEASGTPPASLPVREPRLADEKWARIAADYGGTCVWYRNGVGTCAEELPVNPGLIQALDGWCAWYGCDSEEEIPRHARNPELKFNPWAHRSAGIVLAREVKRQLPDWTIVFGWPFEQVEMPPIPAKDTPDAPV